MKIGWEAVNWVYPKRVVSTDGVFFEWVVEAQVLLKAWHHLTTKVFLKELNNIVPTNTHSLIYIWYNQEHSTDEERLNTQETSP
jgi:hypothetical protein